MQTKSRCLAESDFHSLIAVAVAIEYLCYSLGLQRVCSRRLAFSAVRPRCLRHFVSLYSLKCSTTTIVKSEPNKKH